MLAPSSAVLLVVAVLCLTPAPAGATVYKWVDENGVAHYTLDRDEIPRRFRERLRPTGAHTQPLPTLAPTPSTPSPAPSPTALAPTPPPVEGAVEATLGDVPPPQAPEALTPEAPSALPAPGVDAALSLEQQIARDREAIKQLISSDTATGIGVANDPKLREIAERLPRLQSEYEELQREPRE